MLPAQAPGVYTGAANAIAVLTLLAEFGMFRQALLRDQVRFYAAQSAMIAVLVRSTGLAGAADRSYARRFWAGLNLFAWSMLVAPAMSNLALLWIAIEVTTIVSALLVAMEGTDAYRPCLKDSNAGE